MFRKANAAKARIPAANIHIAPQTTHRELAFDGPSQIIGLMMSARKIDEKTIDPLNAHRATITYPKPLVGCNFSNNVARRTIDPEAKVIMCLIMSTAILTCSI
jgi:hypothetical protein